MTPDARANSAEPPARAAEVFGSALPLASRYRQWLATDGVERGLIGPREVDRLWDRHLLNSSALVQFLPMTGPVVDLGSGAGLPGLVLALLRPDLEIVLVEPMLRRTTFLTEVVDDLGLPQVTVVRARAEVYGRSHPAGASAVVARAVAPLERLAGWAAPLLTPGGALLALKGESAAEEVSAAAAALDLWGLSVQPPHAVTIGATVTHVVRAELVDPARTRHAARAAKAEQTKAATSARGATRRRRP